MICAASKGHTEIVRLFLVHGGTEINIKNIYHQKFWCNLNLIFFIIFYSDTIYDIQNDLVYETAITYARKNNYQDIIDLLLESPNNTS